MARRCCSERENRQAPTNHWSTVAIGGDGASVELYQIRYFLTLCETLNFARAAERCNVSQPSLTRAVQKLEQELGGLLIRRERRLTHLTELGELVRPMLEEVLSHSVRTVSRNALASLRIRVGHPKPVNWPQKILFGRLG